MEEEPDYPNTKRFWRLNETEARIMMAQFKYAGAAQTPEEYDFIVENEQRLKELQAQEQRVMARFKRLSGRGLEKEVVNE